MIDPEYVNKKIFGTSSRGEASGEGRSGGTPRAQRRTRSKAKAFTTEHTETTEKIKNLFDRIHRI